jgi:hypothetical protein
VIRHQLRLLWLLFGEGCKACSIHENCFD